MATPAASPSHFRVTLAGFGIDIPGAFMTQGGGNVTAEVRRFRPGGSPHEEVSGGPTSRDDVTVAREWRRDRDLAIYLWADRNAGRARGSITVQPLDDDYNAYGSPVVYADALLTAAAKPDVDSDAGTDVAQLSLTFAVSGPLA